MNEAMICFVFLSLILAVIFALLGIHPNTFAKIIFSIPYLDVEIKRLLIAGIVGSFLPLSLFVAAGFALPQSETGTGLLPLVKLVKKHGLNYALKLVSQSMLLSLPLALVINYLVSGYYSFFLSILTHFIPCIIMFVAAVMIMQGNPISNLVLMFLSGLLGFFSFSISTDPFFPLFTGFFTVPFLLGIEIRKEGEDRDEKANLIHVFYGVVLGIASCMLPGISSPSQLLSALALPLLSSSQVYLAMLSSFLPSQYISSFFLLSECNKARNGVVIYFKQGDLLSYAFVFSLFCSLACLLGYWLSKHKAVAKFSEFVMKKEIRALILFYIVCLCILFTGIEGLSIFILASALGIYANKSGANRAVLLGSIMLPTLYFYLYK